MPCFWNLNHLEKLLHNYHDKAIVDHLRYGWPISHDGHEYNQKKSKTGKEPI